MSDFPLDSDSEPLSWAQRQIGYDEGKTDDAGLIIDPALSFPWPDDPDERIWTPVYMSLNEYTALLSAVDVGAAIAWTNDALLVYYILVRNYSGGAMEFCARVAQCFEEDAGFRERVINALKNDSLFQRVIQELSGGRSTGPQIEGNLFGGVCDNDVVAGNVIALVDRMNTRNEDFLEIVEVGTNDEERVSAVLSAIPIVSESPIDEILDILQAFLEDFTENYAAAITEDWLAEVYGELFCLALDKEDCSLTFEEVFNYFNQRVGSDLTIASTIQNIFSFIVNGDFSTDDLVASGMYLIQLSFILAGQEFNGMSVPLMASITRDASPSMAWMDWDPCGPVYDRTPVINSLWDPDNTAGMIVGPDEDGFWTATSGTRSFDEAITIMDSANRDFVFAEVTFEDVPACEVWLLDGVLLHISCGSGNVYDGETIDEFTVTWNTGAHRTMRFKMIAPE